MKKILLIGLIFLFSLAGTAIAGDKKGFVNVNYNTRTGIVKWHYYRIPEGPETWGPASEGLVHSSPNPIHFQADQIKSLELCELETHCFEATACVPVSFTIDCGGMFDAQGQMYVFPGADVLIRFTNWSDVLYWEALAFKNVPSRFIFKNVALRTESVEHDGTVRLVIAPGYSWDPNKKMTWKNCPYLDRTMCIPCGCGCSTPPLLTCGCPTDP